MSSDPLMPDLRDVPEDKPASTDHPDEGGVPKTPDTEATPENRTGEKQAQENADREPPA